MKTNKKYQTANAVNQVSAANVVNAVNAVNNVTEVIIEPALNITPETTLNELISLARNNAVEKPETTPKFGTLRKNANCVASYRSDDHRSSLFVYDNGFAAYETDGRTTAIDLDEISSVKYVTAYDNLSMERSDFDREWLGNLPWASALALLGEDQVTHNLFEGKAHELIGEGDYNENEAEDEIKKSNKPNNPTFTAHIDDPETAYIRKETRSEIKRALSKARAQMTVKQAEAFALYYNQDMTEAEIGNILGIARRTVSHRLCLAKQRLHECMEAFQ